MSNPIGRVSFRDLIDLFIASPESFGILMIGRKSIKRTGKRTFGYKNVDSRRFTLGNGLTATSQMPGADVILNPRRLGISLTAWSGKIFPWRGSEHRAEGGDIGA